MMEMNESKTVGKGPVAFPVGYFSFNQFLRSKFGEKVYRVALDGGFTCPNVDGTVTTGGCVYCDNRSFSPNRRGPRLSIKEQVEKGISFLSRRYRCSKFLAYFQAATNTHGKIERLERLYSEALSHPQIVGLAIGTRPDSVPEPVLKLLEGIAKDKFVCLELGLQSAHDRSLVWMNRGHDVASFTDAVQRATSRGFHLCAHVILGLPGESHQDIMFTADYLANLPLDGVKIHNLHVVRDTPMEAMFHRGEIPLPTRQEYVSLLCDFLERIPRQVAIHRINGDSPLDYLVAPQWCLEKNQLLQDVNNEFYKRGSSQGFRVGQNKIPIEPFKKRSLPNLTMV